METVGIAVKFGKEILRFHLKLLTLSEETKMRQQFLGMAKDDKDLKEYEVNVSSLVEFQAEQMERITLDENGAEITELMNVRDYFSGERTAFKERIAEYAVRGLLASLSPQVSFL